VASLSQGRIAAAQCGLFTHKSVPVIFEPPCTSRKSGKIICEISWHFFSEVVEYLTMFCGCKREYKLKNFLSSIWYLHSVLMNSLILHIHIESFCRSSRVKTYLCQTPQCSVCRVRYISVSKILHFAQDAGLLNERAQGLHKRSKCMGHLVPALLYSVLCSVCL